MKKVFIIAIASLLAVACQGNRKATTDTLQTEGSEVAAEEADAELDNEDEVLVAGGLNEIRFRDWTSKEWLDNDYIRHAREFFDAYARGEIKDERFNIEPYKSLVKGNFSVLFIEPFMGGGVYMYIVFLDNPKPVFRVWVYGYVDEKKASVVGYEVRGCDIAEEECDMTKEEILKIIEEHPENKVW